MTANKLHDHIIYTTIGLTAYKFTKMYAES